MNNTPIPADEEKRLASLRKMRILHTPAEEVFDRITKVTQRIFNVPVVYISLVAEDYQWVKSKIGSLGHDEPQDLSICGHVVYSNEMVMVEDVREDARFSDNDYICNALNIRFYAGRPLRNGDGYIVGALCMVDHAPRKITEDDYETLDAIGHWVESVFSARGLSRSMDGLLSELSDARRDSMTDPLLQIWNRGAIEDIMRREADQARRQNGSVAILMADIDYFKKINDVYGHQAGDTALVSVVKSLRKHLRSYDSLGRYGGEEFVIILPSTSEKDAVKLAERLRRAVEKTPVKIGDGEINCTISMGVCVADFSLSEHDIVQTQLAADMALLQAKKNGRNRVEVAASGVS